MRLNDFYRSIGLRGVVENTRKLNKVLRLASFSPDFSYERKKDKKGRIYFDRYKFLGAGFGVSVHGYRHLRTNKEGKRIEKHVVMDWGVFAQGHQDTFVSGTFVDSDADQLLYCFAEDAHSGNNFEFRVNNVLEILDKYQKLSNLNELDSFEDNIQRVNMAMMMVYATVVLPVVKSDENQSFREQEDAIHKELLARARMGDIDAHQDLQNMALEQETDLRERLCHEDLLSVFEGYFLNLVEQSGIFSVLADITAVEELTNEASLERLYRLTVSITDIKITMYVSEADLVGAPTPGMRVMGIGVLQGTVML